MTNLPPPTTVVAEIGCNHMGEMDIAKQMISVAAQFCGVEYVKFQKRNPGELLSAAQYAAPHPNPRNSFGDSYGAHREHLELTSEQHRELQEACSDSGVGYACSVWDLTSAKEIASIEPDFIKIPSATNQHYELLGYLCDTFAGRIHVSLGMTSRTEEERLVSFFSDHSRLHDLVLYACTSGYPVSAEETCLLEIRRLVEAYGSEVAEIGFSGHHLGIALDVAAYTLGATWHERHFTLDRTWKGTDHAASLEPDGMRRLRRDLTAVQAALRFKANELLDVEEPQRAKLKWRTPV